MFGILSTEGPSLCVRMVYAAGSGLINGYLTYKETGDIREAITDGVSTTLSTAITIGNISSLCYTVMKVNPSKDIFYYSTTVAVTAVFDGGSNLVNYGIKAGKAVRKQTNSNSTTNSKPDKKFTLAKTQRPILSISKPQRDVVLMVA